MVSFAYVQTHLIQQLLVSLLVISDYLENVPLPCGHQPTVPSPEVFGNGRSTAEQVSPQRLKLLTETQDGAERLAMFIQTWVELLDIQQGLLIHKFQELLGLFRYLREQISVTSLPLLRLKSGSGEQLDTLCLLVSQLCSRRAGIRKELS